jgi:hypothetical protein
MREGLPKLIMPDRQRAALPMKTISGLSETGGLPEADFHQLPSVPATAFQIPSFALTSAGLPSSDGG